MTAPSEDQGHSAIPPPTPEEIITVMELKSENDQLQEARRCYQGLFHVLYNELEQAFVADSQIREECARLRAELLSLLGAPEGLEGQESDHALHEESAKSFEDFLLYLVNETHSSSSEGFNDKDLLPDLQSLRHFFDSQAHQGAEVFNFKTSMTGCGSDLGTPKMQSAELAFQMRGPASLRDDGTSGSSNPNAAFHSCLTSNSRGHHAPAQQMVMANHPQNLEPHDTFPVLPDVLQNPTAFTGAVPHSRSQVNTARESMVPGDFLRHEEAKPLLHAAETRNLLSPTDLQQPMSSNPIACLPANFANESLHPSMSAHSSKIPGPVAESNLTNGELMLASHDDQPKGTTVELNSTPSSTGAASKPIPDGATTLVIRNVPARYTKELLMQEWPVDGTYDFLFLPFSLKCKRTAGFAFVNFTSHEAAVDFYGRWHGKSLRDQGTAKRLNVGISEVQGLEENLQHVAAHNVSRIKNVKHLPSVFNGTSEVPLAGLLEQINIGGMSGTSAVNSQ